MQRISVHITDETKLRIELAAKAKNKLEAELVREAIDAGLKIVFPRSSSAKGLLELAKMAEKLPSKPDEPRDVSINVDHYAWGGPKKNE